MAETSPGKPNMRRRLTAILTVCLLVASGAGAGFAADWQPAQGPLMTRWAKDVSPDKVHPEYPRPQLVRPNWTNLNGLWDYAITNKGAARPETWDGKILVPFCAESALSGVGKSVSPDQNLWYRRTVEVPISIDTYKSAVARAALSAGADIVNDISALRFDTDMAGLVALLDPDAVYTADGGGKVTAARKLVIGADTIALLTAKQIQLRRPDEARIIEVNGQPALATYRGGRLVWLDTVEIADGRITTFRRLVNPDKLAHLGHI
jgi:hypothetical protein